MNGTYRHCVRRYKSGPRRGRCKNYAPGAGRRRTHRATRRGTITGKFCIRYKRTGSGKRCAEYGTRAQANARGLAPGGRR